VEPPERFTKKFAARDLILDALVQEFIPWNSESRETDPQAGGIDCVDHVAFGRLGTAPEELSCSNPKFGIFRAVGDPGSAAVGPIPLGRPAVLTLFVPDVLDSTEDRKHLAAGAAVLGAELAGEALPVSTAPVDDQPGQTRSVDRPPPRRPDRAGADAGFTFVRACSCLLNPPNSTQTQDTAPGIVQEAGFVCLGFSAEQGAESGLAEYTGR
jgi:hypothetical protein